jgi:2'-5' RNA ligase
LLFLGTVPADRVPLLVAAAAPVVAAAPAMTLCLTGGGRFGSPRRPQVMWVGLDGDVRPLTELARGLAGAARVLDLPVEDRPFRAHLTVGRWRPRRPADATLPSLLADYRGPAWPVTQVRLLESHLGPEPRYEPVAAYPVG